MTDHQHLTDVQAAILDALGAGCMTTSEVAAHVQRSPASTHNIIMKLTARGFITLDDPIPGPAGEDGGRPSRLLQLTDDALPYLAPVDPAPAEPVVEGDDIMLTPGLFLDAPRHGDDPVATLGPPMDRLAAERIARTYLEEVAPIAYGRRACTARMISRDIDDMTFHDALGALFRLAEQDRETAQAHRDATAVIRAYTHDGMQTTFYIGRHITFRFGKAINE